MGWCGSWACGLSLTARSRPAPACVVPCCALPQVVAADLAGESSIAANFSHDLFAMGVLAYEVMTGERFERACFKNDLDRELIEQPPPQPCPCALPGVVS